MTAVPPTGVGSLCQVRRYFEEPEVRDGARDRVALAVSADTRLIVGHSLGSVVVPT